VSAAQALNRDTLHAAYVGIFLWSYTRAGIGSLARRDKVDGTAVYGFDEQKIGSIEHLMIDKISGKVAYAALVKEP
jgi:hypothetical protein